MARVHWSEDALDQTGAIVAYIEVSNPFAAARIGARVIAAGESLADFPRRGRPSLDGTRELVTVPPYVIQYDVVGDDVTILSVRHSRRRPRT